MADFKKMDPEDAHNVLSIASDRDPADVDAAKMIRAGLSLYMEAERLKRELSYLAARLRHPAAQRAPVLAQGHALVEGRSPGGPRHYLNGLPVNAGTSLYLLTELGWLSGRYEWSFEPGKPGRFYFGLPGVYGYNAPNIQIPDGARLAWPNEIE